MSNAESNKTVLVVDDENISLVAITTMLNGKGYIVRIAQSGFEALSSIKEELPDLILLDIQLPDISGFEVCKQLKADEKTRDVPVIFVSAYTEVDEKIRGFDVGGIDYITKPFDLNEILARVNTHTEFNRMRMLVKNNMETQLALNECLQIEIGERKHTEQQLQESLKAQAMAASQLLQVQKLKAIGQLAAGIAHEINTPAQYVGSNLHFIRNAFKTMLSVSQAMQRFVDAANDVPPTKEDIDALRTLFKERDINFLVSEVLEAIAQTQEGVERISAIVRSVKQFAQPGESVMALANLNESIQSTALVSRNEWKYVADLTTELDESLPLVVCMIEEINQVVLNLIVNAAHAIADAIKVNPERKGRITLTTRYAPPWAEIRVSDTGMGIPPSVQDKIFDPFFTTKEVGQGMGQSLAIGRTSVVERHQGQFFFETEPGVGTTFVVRLPLEPAE